MAHDVERETRHRQITVTEGTHVTLPKSVLDAANLHTGDVVEVIADGNGELRLHRVNDEIVADEEARRRADDAWWDAFHRLCGSVPGASMRDVRDDWEQ